MRPLFAMRALSDLAIDTYAFNSSAPMKRFGRNGLNSIPRIAPKESRLRERNGAIAP
jgi:hypothetical protein